jgi:hypothetical protein
LTYDIGPQFTFYGYIPDNSIKQHLGIVLNEKEGIVKYCYCTSKFRLLQNETDFIRIAKEKMRAYFNDPQDTYIFLSQRHIIDILLITFISRIKDNEYEERVPIDNDLYITIVSKIKNSENLPERFKQEIIRFL